MVRELQERDPIYSHRAGNLTVNTINKYLELKTRMSILGFRLFSSTFNYDLCGMNVFEGKGIADQTLRWTSLMPCENPGDWSTRKVGHAAPWIPLATGLLIICTEAYQKIQWYMAQEKEYTVPSPWEP